MQNFTNEWVTIIALEDQSHFVLAKVRYPVHISCESVKENALNTRYTCDNIICNPLLPACSSSFSLHFTTVNYSSVWFMSLLDLPCKASEISKLWDASNSTKQREKTNRNLASQLCGHFTCTQLTRSANFPSMHSGPWQACCHEVKYWPR